MKVLLAALTLMVTQSAFAQDELAGAAGRAAQPENGAAITKQACIAKLVRGNMFLAPSRKLVVETPLAAIHVDPGAKVLVVKTETELSIYNLCDRHRNQVKIVVGKHVLKPSPGQQILLTRLAGTFERINPPTSIAYRNVKEVTLTNGLRVFDCDFSLPSALMNVPALRYLGGSSDRQQRNIHDEIEKTAAIMTYLKSSGGQYKPTRQPAPTTDSAEQVAMFPNSN